MHDLLIAGLIYALFAVDHIAVGQFMLSRPLVVGPVLGAYFHNTPLGLLAGVVTELAWVHVIPVGIWPIDTTVVAALSVAWCALSANPSRSSLVVALLAAVPCGVAARYADIWFRRQNGRFIQWVADSLRAGREGALTQAVVMALALWFAKAWAVFVVFGFVGHFVVNAVLSVCSPRAIDALDFAGRALPLLGFCVVLNYFVERAWVKGPWITDRSPNP